MTELSDSIYPAQDYVLIRRPPMSRTIAVVGEEGGQAVSDTDPAIVIAIGDEVPGDRVYDVDSVVVPFYPLATDLGRSWKDEGLLLIKHEGIIAKLDPPPAGFAERLEPEVPRVEGLPEVVA